MTVVRLGAWCDYVTDEEARAEFFRPPRPESPRDGAGPVPGLADARAVEEALEHHRRSAAFRVHEFAVLDDGRRLTLSTDRGFALSGPADPWAALTLESVEADVRTTVLPDDDTGEAHPWAWLAERLRAEGVDVTPEHLAALPYEVVFSDRLRARLAP